MNFHNYGNYNDVRNKKNYEPDQKMVGFYQYPKP